MIVRERVCGVICDALQGNQKKLFGEIVQFEAARLQAGNGSGLGLWRK